MIKLRALAIAAGAAGALAAPVVAQADSCANASRPAPACGKSCTSVVTEGNWVWLPSLANVGEAGLPPVWGFAPPGALDSALLGTPGSDGNYADGQTTSLLGMSALCDPGSTAASVRQSGHGIQSGCE